MEWMGSLGAVEAALIATLFTWIMTALGASLVFVFSDMHRKWFDSMLGFTGGVMVAASFWSLLSPAIELSRLSISSLYSLVISIFNDSI